jgi:flagellar biosynthesis GTPase FlhF
MKFKSIAILTFLICLNLRADTVVMKNLESLHGDLVKETPDWVELRVEYGTLKIPREKILRIETDTPEMIAEREAKAAKEKELTDEMIAEGKVKYHGKWVTPAQKAADEKKIAEAKRKKEEEIAAAKKKAADALAKQKKEEQAAAALELAQAKAQAQIDAQIKRQTDQFYRREKQTINQANNLVGQALRSGN